jgi:hypothetical protein
LSTSSVVFFLSFFSSVLSVLGLLGILLFVSNVADSLSVLTNEVHKFLELSQKSFFVIVRKVDFDLIAIFIELRALSPNSRSLLFVSELLSEGLLG